MKSKYMTLDVVLQILRRLTVSSVMKCMCVCKEWYFLITSHEFVTTHFAHWIDDSPPNFLIGHKIRSPRCDFFTLYSNNEVPCLLRPIPSPFCLRKHKGLGVHIVGSVHGLICINVSCSFCNSYIWNPSINRYLEIPESYTIIRTPELQKKYATGYKTRGPLEHLYAVIGFGFDSLKDDYKVVRIVFELGNHNDEPWQVGVYSLKERLWKELDVEDVPTSGLSPWHSSYFMNKSVLWYAYGTILGFDMNDEYFYIIGLPEEIGSNGKDVCFSETNGLLSIYCYKDIRIGHNDFVKSCDVWVMKEYGDEDSWTKIYTFDFKGLDFSVLNVRENGEILVAKNLNRKGDEQELALYDPTTKVIKTFGTRGNFSVFYGGVYGESLLLLNEDSGAVSYVESN